MRKRRRLANKMTIMVCAVLLAVSAFFYAPMEVRAEESVNFTDTFIEDSPDVVSSDEIIELTGSQPAGNGNEYYFRACQVFLGSFDLKDYFSLDDDTLYEIELTFTGSVKQTSASVYSYPNDFVLANSVRYQPFPHFQANYNGDLKTVSNTFNILFYGNDSAFRLSYSSCLYSQVINTLGVDVSASITFGNLKEIISTGSDDYQNGYNAGYSDGESAGYGNGYSQGFTDGEASVDTDAIYDEAYQAGVDSVDTQSYYDAGYEAGYQVAYSEGYENGYDAGYQEVMDRVENWGADTSEYPKLLTTKTMSKWGNPSEVQAGVVTDVNASLSVDSGINVNPNHTYRFDISVTDYDVTGSSYIDPPVNHDLYFYVGSNEFYLISQNRTSCNQTLYVNGSTMSDVFGFIGKAYNVHVLDTQTTDQLVYTYLGYTVKIYDMGPTGDTQNHIANQTDQLTNGYDDSKGNKVNSDLSTGLNDYESAENSLFATATTGMKDFTFFDFESVPAMITGMSFIGSIMGSWFNQAGGASGVGIVLSILFSVILVAMVLGLYRWYQSRGGKN